MRNKKCCFVVGCETQMVQIWAPAATKKHNYLKHNLKSNQSDPRTKRYERAWMKLLHPYGLKVDVQSKCWSFPPRVCCQKQLMCLCRCLCSLPASPVSEWTLTFTVHEDHSLFSLSLSAFLAVMFSCVFSAESQRWGLLYVLLLLLTSVMWNPLFWLTGLVCLMVQMLRTVSPPPNWISCHYFIDPCWSSSSYSVWRHKICPVVLNTFSFLS